MKLRSAQRTRGILVAIVLAGLVAWAPATADEEQELSLHERLDKNLLGMQNNLTNASAGQFLAMVHSLQSMQRSWRIWRNSDAFPNIVQPFTHLAQPMQRGSSISY